MRVGNVASERVLERAGFAREGVKRRYLRRGGEEEKPTPRCSPASQMTERQPAAMRLGRIAHPASSLRRRIVHQPMRVPKARAPSASEAK